MSRSPRPRPGVGPGVEVAERLAAGLPSTFRARISWVEGEAGPQAGVMEAFARELTEALELDSTNREGAFALLAADALVTRAAEVAALEEDGEELLRLMVHSVSRGEV